MKTLILSFLVLFAACNTAPDGVIVDGDEARVATLASLDMFDSRGNLTEFPKWAPEEPKLAVRKWLYENDYEYSHFEPDTTLGKIAGDNIKPIYAGFMVYQR